MMVRVLVKCVLVYQGEPRIRNQGIVMLDEWGEGNLWTQRNGEKE